MRQKHLYGRDRLLNSFRCEPGSLSEPQPLQSSIHPPSIPEIVTEPQPHAGYHVKCWRNNGEKYSHGPLSSVHSKGGKVKKKKREKKEKLMSLLTGERQSPRKIFFLFFSIYFLIGRKFLYNVVLAFCCTATRISHNYTYITSLLSLPPLPLFHPSRSSQSARLGSLCYIAASHQLSVLHIAVYIC